MYVLKPFAFFGASFGYGLMTWNFADFYLLFVSMPKKYELLNFRVTEPNWPLI